MKRMHATRINADIKAINKKSAIENPRHPRSILFQKLEKKFRNPTH